MVWCVVLCWDVCGVVCQVCDIASKPRVSTQHVSVCKFKTSPCLPAPRAHMLGSTCNPDGSVCLPMKHKPTTQAACPIL